MARVDVDRVVKSYGSVPVVHGVSVTIKDGEFVVLVGPSGCGKTTLLRMIAGLEEISSGTVSIGGNVVNDVPSKSRNIAMVFQNYALYPHMTVADNMGFALKLAKVPQDQIAAKTKEAADILGLGKLLDRFPRQLSGGQRQRVAMGRAIVRNPEVFLFDEPLSNLDAKLRVSMRSEIRMLQQRLKTTTIYVTHDQIEAMTMADKIVVMRDGIVEQVGPPLELYDFPANAFVASFIGSPAMNFITGQIEQGTLGVEFVADGGSRWPVRPGKSYSLGRRYSLGIRPEHLRLVQNGAGIQAKIEVLEPTGSETQVHFGCGNDLIVGVFRERIELPIGASVGLQPDIEKVHLFDEGTGERVP